MLMLAIISIVVCAISSALAVFVLTMHVGAIREGGGRDYVHGHNAVVEPLIAHASRKLGEVHGVASKHFYSALLHVMSRFIPWFRKVTFKFENSLHNMAHMVRGKRDVSNAKRENTSQFLKDIREQKDANSGSIEG